MRVMNQVSPVKHRMHGLALLVCAGVWGCGGGGTTGGLNNTNMTGNPSNANPSAVNAAVLPLTMDDNTVNYSTSPIEGGSGAVVKDPSGDTGKGNVLQVTVIGQSTYDGVTLISSGQGLGQKIAFSAAATQIKADVYSPAAGTPILLKAETADGKSCTATVAQTSKSKAWETLTFEFKNSIAAGTGCTAPVYTNSYVKLSVLPGYGSKASSVQNYYLDNLLLGGTTNIVAATLPVNFDTENVNYTTASIAAGSGAQVSDPASGGTRGSVLKITTGGTGATTYDGVTLVSTGDGLGSAVGFTSTIKTLTLDVYAPAINTPILLKVENATNGAQCSAAIANTTKANAWETLTFNFANSTAGGCQAANLAYQYTKISVFPNFGTAATAATSYYVDNLALGSEPPPPPAEPGSTGTCTSSSSKQCYSFSESGFKLAPFGELTAVTANDPVVVSPANVIAQLVTAANSNGWGGATLDPLGTGVNKVAPLVFGANKLVTLRVYSPKAGVPVLLKFESAANAGDNLQMAVKTTVANQWETLTYDFAAVGSSNNAAAFPFTGGSYDATKTYDRVSIFPDFATSDPKPNGAQTYRFDELSYPTGTPVVPTPTWSAIAINAVAEGGGTSCTTSAYDATNGKTLPTNYVTGRYDSGNGVSWWWGGNYCEQIQSGFGFNKNTPAQWGFGLYIQEGGSGWDISGASTYKVRLGSNAECVNQCKVTLRLVSKADGGACVADYKVTLTDGALKDYAISMSSSSWDVKGCTSVANTMAGFKTAKVAELHYQLLNADMQFVTTSDGSASPQYPNGLGVGGGISFQ